MHIVDAILPQTGTKLTKKRGPKFGALLWRHLTPQEKSKHRCTTTIHPVYNCSKRFLKIYFLYRTFGAHKLVNFELFLDYLYEF